ncbi:MAG: hypothetical protein AAGJ38_05070, partial [Planctomycetota bacterium]
RAQPAHTVRPGRARGKLRQPGSRRRFELELSERMGCTARELKQRMSCLEFEERMVLEHVRNTENTEQEILFAHLIRHLHLSKSHLWNDPQLSDFLPDKTPKPELSNASKRAMILGWARSRIARQEGRT